MTDALRKRAERQRRREAGEVRVEVWLAADEVEWLDAYCKSNGKNRSEAIKSLARWWS